ncbi:extensin [Streptomyces sp. NBC_01314]|uniref:extensin n=1 Tax=Streptomyces sp. NBC_01314 TaxID=2903821 RepID=UPI00308E9D20|nr:extensin [Streptomyces sp. NBC_01314]
MQRLKAHKPTAPTRTALPLAVAPRTPSTAPVTPRALAPTPAPTPAPVQRAPEIPLRPIPATTTTAVAPVTATAATSGSTTAHRTASADLPPPYSAVENDASPKAQFDPRTLTDFQLDELTHKLIGRITRLVRTELRLDRERIGKLRDPRH